MHRVISLFALATLLLSCESSWQVEAVDSPTEGFVLKAVPYGPEPRQFVDIYKAASDCPTPGYFDAHGNGGTTNMPSSIINA
ncbi:MAG: hypothetical protein AAGJ10_21105, partial [Bacteroidota bacterium]